MSQEITVTLSFREFISATAALRQRISRLERFGADGYIAQHAKDALEKLQAADRKDRIARNAATEFFTSQYDKPNPQPSREQSIQWLTTMLLRLPDELKRAHDDMIRTGSTTQYGKVGEHTKLIVTKFADAIAPVPDAEGF